MADTVAVKRALARLASDADADRAVIAQASAAVEDLDAAVSFVEDVGVERLAVAVERQRSAGNTAAVARGERTLEAFRRYRQAAGTTTQAPSGSSDRANQPNQPDQPDQPSRPLRASATQSTPDEHDASESGTPVTAGSVSNGDVGGRLDLEPFEPRLESVGVGIEPVDGDWRPGPVLDTDGEMENEVDSRGSASGWRTLCGNQFHRGDGTDIRSAPEEGRR